MTFVYFQGEISFKQFLGNINWYIPETVPTQQQVLWISCALDLSIIEVLQYDIIAYSDSKLNSLLCDVRRSE